MIFNQVSSLMTALEWVNSSQLTFYLTGSRGFHLHNEKSDFDFFVQEAPGVKDQLEAAGFRLDNESYAQCRVFTAVYKRDNVHIQIVRNAEIKWHVQNRLQPLFRHLKPTKEHAVYLWQLALQLYDDGMRGERMGLKS